MSVGSVQPPYFTIGDRFGAALEAVAPAAIGGGVAAHTMMSVANRLGGAGHTRGFTLVGMASFASLAAVRRFFAPPTTDAKDNLAGRAALEGALGGGALLGVATAGNFARGGQRLPGGSVGRAAATCIGAALVGALTGAIGLGGGTALLEGVGGLLHRD